MSSKTERPAPPEEACELAGLLGIPPSKVGRVLSLAEAAEILGLSMATLRRRITAGALVVVRDGGRVQVTPRDLGCYIAARRGP